jgi:DNA-binding NarL/FixJ family response regulator
MPGTVMVVDDTDHVRRMLHEMLVLDGFTVVADAASATEALERIDDADPDVVVLDYMMPGVDGIEAARQLRQRRPNQAIILYSAFIDGELLDRAAAIGIDVCVPKAEGVEALEREIARLLL